MSKQVTLRLTNREADELDRAVVDGAYPTASAALRAGLALLVRAERDRTIAEQYRRAYGSQPQEAWTGEAGMELGARLTGDLESPEA